MIKLIIINHTFQKPEFYKRWKCLTEKHKDIDITLLAPVEWAWGEEKTLTFGSTEYLQGTIVDEERFRIHLIDTKKDKMGEWRSVKLDEEILSARPDIVYFIGGHTAAPLMQIINLRNKYHYDNMKIMAFSMRGHTPTIDFKGSEPGIRKYVNTVGKYFILGPRVKKCNKYCDVIFCHYPAALKAFRDEGFKKPIYMQTQVGVDPDVFGPNMTSRKKIRDKYNLGDSFVFGSASRFHYSKGLSEIVQALPSEGDWKYLMMGWGRDDEVDKIKNEIANRGFEDKIILTGFIDNWTDMAEHWNALDCAVHTPLTTSRWEETFSLALVQAMITGLPVIGSNSGSVPYQIGEEGILCEEGNIEEMRKQMLRMMNNTEERNSIGEKMRKRALECFNIYYLDELFYLTIQDLLNGIYDPQKIDMTKYKI
jgi:glycosyltransferase involved in cell wall biosynthesis